MNGGQSEQLKSIKKAMKIHELVNSDKSELTACKNDLMKKLAMGESDAEAMARAIRDMFLPKYMKAEGLERDDMPEDFDVKMPAADDSFANEPTDDIHDGGCGCSLLGHEEEPEIDDSEVDADEIATIHITVPKDKIREVESALESVLGDNDAKSTDQAESHKDNETLQGDDMDKKELEARKALRKTILAAMSDYDEDSIQEVSRVDHFDMQDEKTREPDFYETKKGELTDPEYKTLDYNKNKVPVQNDHRFMEWSTQDSLEKTKFDGTPSDVEEFKLNFDPFEIPTQGDDELFVHPKGPEIPSEGDLRIKRNVQAAAEPTELDEEILASALRSAGVEDEDLAKLTYAEAKELFKAIRTASEDREHYSKDGTMPASFNDPKDPDKKEASREAVTEDDLRDHSESEEDPESEHERKKLYSSTKEAQVEETVAGPDDKYSAYANMIKKLMRGKEEERKADMTGTMDVQVKTPQKVETSVSPEDMKPVSSSEDAIKQAELYKARVKTAYAMSGKLAVAELLPAEEMDAYAEGMLNDGLTVTAMIKQTKILLNTAANNAEKLAASQNGNVRTASKNGIGYNPTVRANADLSGARDIQDALKNIGWTTAKVSTGMEE